jgi:hypothetical protein
MFAFINPGRSLCIFIRALFWKTIVGEDKETQVDIIGLQVARCMIGDNSVAIQCEIRVSIGIYDNERFDVIF